MASEQHIIWMNMANTGHINPTLPVVAELVARGCQVTYFVESTIRDVVEAAGATWRPFRYPDSDFTGTLTTMDTAGVDMYVPEGTPREEYEALLMAQVHNAERVLPAFLQDLRALNPAPAVIVYEPIIGSIALVAAHVLGLPAVCFFTMPGPGVFAQPSEVVDAWESRPWVKGPRQAIVERYGFDVHKNGIGGLEFYSPLSTIVTTIDDFFAPVTSVRQKERFGHFPFTCVGALFDSKVKRLENANVSKDQEEGSLSDAVLARRLEEATRCGCQVLYVSMGTVATGAEFWNKRFGDLGRLNGLAAVTGREVCQHVWRSCFEAFGESERMLVVLSVGPQEDALIGLPAAPANFVVRKSVPQLQVLAKCDAVVMNGGANTLHEALAFAVPLVAVPMFGDQPTNARALERSGAGAAFHNPMCTLSAATLRDAIRTMLDPVSGRSYRNAACAVQQKLRDAGGVQKAADLILQHAPVLCASRGGA